MNKIIVFIMLFLFNSLFAAIEEPLPRPEDAKNYDELQKTINDLEAAKKESKDNLAGYEKVRDLEDIKKEQERIKLIDYGIARAQFRAANEGIFLEGLKNELAKTGENYTTYSQNAESKRKELEDYFNEQSKTAQDKLSREISTAKSLDQIKTGLSNAIDTLTTTFYNRPKTITLEDYEYLNKIDKLQNIIEEGTRVQRLLNEAKNRENLDQKLQIFADSRSKLVDTLEIINNELKTTSDKAYQNRLNSFKDAINSRLQEIASNAFSQSGITKKENLPFWRRIFNGVKSTFNKLHKLFVTTTISEKIVDEINAAKSDIAAAENLIDTIEDNMLNAQALLKKARLEGIGPYGADLKEIGQQLLDLQNNLTVDDKNLITEVNERMKEMTGDLDAYALRYRNAEKYNNLFDSLYDNFTLLFTPFSADHAYSMIGLKPDATSDDIEKAREQVSKLGVETQENKAKRNAAYLLANKVSRQTYDAFMKDYNKLIAAGKNPADKSKPKTAADIENTRTIELPKDQLTQLEQAGEIFVPFAQRTGGLFSRVGALTEIPPVLTDLAQVVKDIRSLVRLEE